MIKTLLPFLSKYKKYAILTPLMVVGEVLMEIAIPVLMAAIVDTGITNRDIRYVLTIGGLMIVMALISLLFGALAARFGSKAGMGFGCELRRGLFDKISGFSFSNIDKFSSASLVTRLTTDVNTTQMAVMMALRVAVRAPFMLISATFMAFAINPSLVTVFLVAIPVLAVALAIIATMTYPRFLTMLRKYDALNASVQENLRSVRVVKSFVRAAYEKKKFGEANDNLMNSSIRAEKILNFNMPIMQLTMYGCIIAILWFGGGQIIAGTMMTGELISFISYVMQILMSLMMIAMIFIQLVMMRSSLTRIVEVLSETPDIKDPETEGAVEQDASIVFDNVSFCYGDGGDVLKHINLRIEPGETVGIIGGTGSSKSTLVQLIPRLYDVTGGRVLVGGRDVRDYKLEDLRKTVGMVLQKNVLFSGTIRDNLRWGNENATDEEIIAACKAAQAHDFITSFPYGYDTELGQGGVNVSGGQKQRLCIARALLKKPQIIILDDSTSAVDTATDALIRKALAEDLKGTTTIIIAQRVTSVCDADKIVVMDDGRIDAVGTHEELLKTNEIYRDVYESQQKGVA